MKLCQVADTDARSFFVKFSWKVRLAQESAMAVVNGMAENIIAA